MRQLEGKAAALLAAAALGGCAVGPDFVRPAAPSTDHSLGEGQDPGTASAGGVTQRFATGSGVPADWWTLFKSPALDAAVQRALSDSPTREAAQASLRQGQDNLRS